MSSSLTGGRLNVKAIGDVVLGRYRIAKELGEGSMGTVYLGRIDGPKPEQPVIIKWINPLHLKTDQVVEWFQKEIHKLKQLQHAGIARVLEFGADNHSHFLVTEYVHGFTLKHWLEYSREAHGQFPVEPAIQIAIEVLRALGHAHTLQQPVGTKLNIVHRDVRPSNVLIDSSGRVKLTDFGIAQLSSEGTSVTDPGALEKIGYHPPEVIANTSPDLRSDIYGVGLLLHEMLLGRNEFVGDSPPATITAVLVRKGTRVDQARPDVPKPIADAIERALAKKPAERFANATDFIDALGAGRQGDEHEVIRELRGLAGEDFSDPRMAELAGMPSLGDRDRSITGPIKIQPKDPLAMPQVDRAKRPTAEAKQRMRFSASGEVDAPAAPRAGQVVWRAPPRETIRPSEPRRPPPRTSPLIWVGLGALVILVVLAIVLALT